MATINGLGGHSAAVPFKTRGAAFVLENEVDLDALNVSDGDVVQALPAGDGMRVLMVETEIVTPSDAATSATMDIGDGADADGYDAGVNLKASAGTITCTDLTSDAYGASGKRYTSNDTIDLTVHYSGAVTVKGKVKVRALGFKME